MYRIYAKSFYVFCLYFSKLSKIRKMFARQSLVNVTLKIRTKFHSNLLVKYRDILHTVSKNLVFEKIAFKISKRHFSYVFFTYSFHLYIAAHSSYNSQLNWIQVPWYSIRRNLIFKSHDLHFIILLKVVNSDTNSIILYPRIYHYTPK